LAGNMPPRRVRDDPNVCGVLTEARKCFPNIDDWPLVTSVIDAHTSADDQRLDMFWQTVSEATGVDSARVRQLCGCLPLTNTGAIAALHATMAGTYPADAYAPRVGDRLHFDDEGIGRVISHMHAFPGTMDLLRGSLPGGVQARPPALFGHGDRTGALPVHKDAPNMGAPAAGEILVLLKLIADGSTGNFGLVNENQEYVVSLDIRVPTILWMSQQAGNVLFHFVRQVTPLAHRRPDAPPLAAQPTSTRHAPLHPVSAR